MILFMFYLVMQNSMCMIATVVVIKLDVQVTIVVLAKLDVFSYYSCNYKTR